MCGIAGIIDERGVDQDLLWEMGYALVHRGPDDGDIYVDGIVGLAHRRLAIIDLSPTGKQPMKSNNEDIIIVFNGEIYNFLELRDLLVKKNYRFRGSSDTEVLLTAYEEWGYECLNRLNGMFAFAIYDRSKRQIFLARDPIGKKPIYYSSKPKRFIFASEIKSILKDRTISREIDICALNHYLTFGYVGSEMSIFREIKKLPPASAMVLDLKSGSVKTWRYWNLPEVPEYCYEEEDLLNELEDLILNATRIRLHSDVPLGAFLSGGLDSSLIVAAMNKVGAGKIKTFSVGFSEKKFSELPYARIVAQHFGTEHHELIAEPGTLSFLPELMEKYDEPLADSSIIPTYLVAKATRSYVKVALSGDGGDELFGGYSHYRHTLLDKHLHSVLPRQLSRFISLIAQKLPDKIRGKRSLFRLRYSPERSFVDRIGNDFFKKEQREWLLNPKVRGVGIEEIDEPEHRLSSFLESYSNYEFINKLCCADFLTYLPDDVMVKVDRATMAVSLESRAPLLDKRIVEFSFQRIPGRFKVNGVTGKILLKKLATKWLPKDLFINRKQGFGLPLSLWLKDGLQNDLKEILLNYPAKIFNRGYIQMLLQEHANGIDHSMRLFTLLVFNLWHKIYCE